MSETRDARAQRLRAALRDNLRRRKAQARERAAGSDAGAPGEAQAAAPERDEPAGRA